MGRSLKAQVLVPPGLLAERVAAMRDEPVAEIKHRTAGNARRLFGLEATWGVA